MAPTSAVTVLESHRCVSCPFFWIPIPSSPTTLAIAQHVLKISPSLPIHPNPDSFPTNGVSRHRRG